MEPQLNIDQLETIITALSDEKKIAGLGQFTIGQPQRSVADMVAILCEKVISYQYASDFKEFDFDELRRELTGTREYHNFYAILQDKDKRTKLLDVVKHFYRLEYEKQVAEKQSVLMVKPIAQMTGEDFKLYLEIIGIIKPLWAR